MITFASTHSPFYRQLYRDLPPRLADLSHLPPVTRQQLVPAFDQVVTDPALSRAGVAAFINQPQHYQQRGQLHLGRYRVWTTSGVTAEPRIFVHDADALAVYATLSLLRGWLPWMLSPRLWSVLRQGDRVASVVGAGLHFPSAGMLEHQRQQRPWPFNQLRLFPIQLPLTELVQQLNAFQPAELIGYPSSLALLAHEQTAGRLAIRPALVGSGGEWLSPDNRRLIESAFCCPIRENYGAAEIPQAVWACHRERLHVSADWVVIEAVDERYQPVPPGQMSHTTLVTNLANRVMPTIRYDLGDRIAYYPDRCPCGSHLPTLQVEGRRDDTLVFQSPAGETVRLIPIAFGMTITRTPGVRQFQLIQTGPAALTLRLDLEPGADRQQVWDATVQRLREFLTAQSLPQVSIHPSLDAPRSDPRHGKFRRVWSQLEPTLSNT